MRTPTLPAWLARVLAGVVLTQAALFLARPVTSYRALALGADARGVGLITAAFALVPLVELAGPDLVIPGPCGGVAGALLQRILDDPAQEVAQLAP